VDVLESGPGRPGRWRRLWVLLLTVAGVAGLVALRVAASGSRPAAPAPPAAATPTAVGTVEPAPAIPSCPTCRPGRFSLHATSGYGPAGMRVAVGGRHPAVLDIATGRTTPVGPLHLESGQGTTLYPVPGGLVASIYGNGGDVVGGYLLPDSGGTVRLGAFDQWLPDRDGGFLGYRGAWNGHTGLLAAYTSSGRERWRRVVLATASVLRDTPYGLLVQTLPTQDSGVGPIQLLDARTGRVLRRIAVATSVLTSTDRAVVWLDGPCHDDGGPCRVVVTDLATGRGRTFPPPLGRVPSTAALSPDGRLAVGVSGLHDFLPGAIRDGFAAVLDPTTGRLEPLPGLSTQAKHAPVVAWSPNRPWLLMAVQPDDYHDRLVLWRVGDAELTALPTALPAWSLAYVSGLALLP
jgi:hypothetical protein